MYGGVPLYFLQYLYFIVFMSQFQCVATFRRKSQLSKTLVEVLMDDSVLPYFMEYMQKHNATNLLNFWLTAETFRLSTINRLRINSMSRLKSSKGDSTSAIPGGDVPTMLNSSDLCALGDSLDQLKTCTNSSGTADQSWIQIDDNNEFGDFTGYEPESSASADSIAKNSGDVLLLCNNCGRIINPPSSNKDACDHCGQSIGDQQTSSNPYCSSNQEETFISGLQNGINQLDKSNQSNLKNIQDTKDFTNSDTGTQKGFRSSKVTFDLTPDFEHEQRGFCRRRTRSIVIDAISIYSKYISLEASNPIGLEESIRRQIESKLNNQNYCVMTSLSL